MNITILAYGSQGDVRPLVALGRGLQRGANHRVRIATDREFRSLVEKQDLDFAATAGNFREQLLRRIRQISSRPLRLLNEIRLGRDMAYCWGRDVIGACEDADAIIASGVAIYGAGIFVERHRTPLVLAWLQPVAPTREFTSPLIPPLALPGPLARLTHNLLFRAVWLAARPIVNEMRRQAFGLPPWSFRRMRAAIEPRPTLCAVSPALVPRPADWPAHVTVTGFWFLDEPDWQPDPALARFLATGQPPVYIGFGSMIDPAPAELAHLILAALTRSNQRAVVATGWGGPATTQLTEAATTEHLYLVETVPHDRLFPRVAAAVHHGGVGTTAATLRAGIPSVVIPFESDQPFWAHRLWCAGCAPPPLPRRGLTAERLAAAIIMATRDREMQSRARALGEAIRREDGTGTAVRAVERAVAEEQSRHVGLVRQL